MSKVSVYNTEGKEMDKINLPEKIFGLKINNDLIYQAVNIQLANRRKALAHTKDRGDVRGGGRKPWRQKGTGRARHGSNRSPIWVGGGVTFGPTKDKHFDKKINKKTKRKVLFMILSSKIKDKELIVLEKLEIKEPKTKTMAKILKQIINKKQESVLIVTAKKDENIIRATKNIPYAKTISVNSLNTIDLLSFKYLLTDKDGIKGVEKIYGPSK